MEGNHGTRDDAPSARSRIEPDAAGGGATRDADDRTTGAGPTRSLGRWSASHPTPLLRRRRAPTVPRTSPARTTGVTVPPSRPTPLDTQRLVTGEYSLVDTRPDAPLADPLLGRVVADRYRIVEILGRGGMGSVYRVEHTRIGKLLAMKLLSGELSQRPEAVRRFKREALTVSKLTSPNTVQVFDFGTSDGLSYLVMELVSGQSLGDLARAAGPMPWARAARIVIQIASSLSEAHGLGIVHRDIKPENVMLVPGEGGVDVAKVLDFGLAKLREPEGAAEVTSHGMILGTPTYMAPEQIRGEAVDPRSDIYSVGALLYRLITGEPPFRSDSALSVLSKHLHEAPIPPIERAPGAGIPAGLSRLVMRALRKRPEDRFQRIEDLQRELVVELGAAGSASAEGLLDPGRVARLARAVAADAPEVLATRDEVDAYERRLRRTRKGAVVAGFAATVGAAILVASALSTTRAPVRGDVEIEPNDGAAQATPLVLGQALTGQLGRRLDPSHGDRDVYAFELPEAAPGRAPRLRLRVSALPTMAICALVYRQGFADPMGQYCPGRAGRDLVVDGLAIAPGRYLVAVLQDLDGYGGEAPAIQESISDSYVILVEAASASPSSESEPNDDAASASRVSLGRPTGAALGWARDEDLFCLDDGAGDRVRFRVRPGPREAAALEATPILDGRLGAPARVLPADAASGWVSAVLPPTAAARCLRVRRGREPGAVRASAASDAYTVEAERAP